MQYSDYNKARSLALSVLSQKRYPIDEEIIGEVIHTIYKAEHDYNNKIGSFEPYRNSRINYCLLDYYKRNKKWTKRMLQISDVKYSSLSYNHKFSDFIFEDIKKLLTEFEYKTIVGKIVYNKNFQEIGTENNVSKQHACLQYKKALKKLREYYDAEETSD